MKGRKKKNNSEPDNIENNFVNEPATAYSITYNSEFNVAGKNFVQRVLLLLGIASASAAFSKAQNTADFIACIREGVPKKAFDNLLNVTGLTAIEMAGLLHTSERNLRRYAAHEKLNSEQSERIIELAKVYTRGEDVFGSREAFQNWMNNPVMAFQNQKPKSYLDTSLGIEMLMEELGRIEHGIFA